MLYSFFINFNKPQDHICSKKISQEQIKQEQEAYKRKLDNIQEFYATDFSSEATPKYLPLFDDSLEIKYNITSLDFSDFQDFLSSRKAAQLPFQFKDKNDYSDYNLDPIIRISSKGYPYYGKLGIKLKDSKGNEFDSYGYVYDTDKSFDGVDDYIYRDFKATVQPTSTTNTYEIYCDGQKAGSKQFTTTQRNITNYESNMEGMGLLGALLQTFAIAYIENLETNSFEGQLYKAALEKTCFYQEDLTKKNKVSSLAYLKEASSSFDNAKYIEAIRKIDASIWAHKNLEAYVLRANIYSRFYFFPEALSDYLAAIKLSNNDDATLIQIYKKLAAVLANFQVPTDINFEENTMTIFPEMALDYLKKASNLGDLTSKNLLQINDRKILFTKIKELK